MQADMNPHAPGSQLATAWDAWRAAQRTSNAAGQLLTSLENEGSAARRRFGVMARSARQDAREMNAMEAEIERLARALTVAKDEAKTTAEIEDSRRFAYDNLMIDYARLLRQRSDGESAGYVPIATLRQLDHMESAPA